MFENLNCRPIIGDTSVRKSKTLLYGNKKPYVNTRNTFTDFEHESERSTYKFKISNNVVK